MKLRFSIRTILLVTTLLGCVLYWRVRPSIVANKFTQAVADKNYEAADALSDLELAGFLQPAKDIAIDVHFDEPTIGDWLLGRRRGRFVVGAIFERYGIARDGTLTATATGVKGSAVSEAQNQLTSEPGDISDAKSAVSDWLGEVIAH